MSSPSPDVQTDGAVNCCRIFLVGSLIISMIVAISFSAATLGSCEFIEFRKLDGNNLTLNAALSSNSAAVIPDMATFGILQWSPDASGCRKYDNITELSSAYLAARVGGVSATLFGSIAVLILFVELVCCRFICSRVLVSCLLMLAVIGQGLTFLFYATNICLSKSYVSYACGFEIGTLLSVVAVIFYFIAAIMACPTPKPKPLIRYMVEQDWNKKDSDPCCYCFRESFRAEMSQKSGHPDQLQSQVAPAQFPVTEMISMQPIPEKYPTEVHTPTGGLRHQQKSFANAEVIEDDLFFDSKTV